MMIIELKNVDLVKKDKVILDDVSFAVAEGDILGIVGPSGAGKSSLLRLLNMLDSFSAGEIFFRERALTEYNPLLLRREIGYVLQKPFLFGQTVKDNLVYPYQLLKLRVDMDEIVSYLERVNLSAEVLTKKSGQLSGGEQQRVALVRSMLVKPRVLLLDEVTAALDEENIDLVEKLVMSEQEERGLTVLFISHNLEQVRRMAGRVLYMVAGKLEFAGSVEDFFRQREVLLDE